MVVSYAVIVKSVAAAKIATIAMVVSVMDYLMENIVKAVINGVIAHCVDAAMSVFSLKTVVAIYTVYRVKSVDIVQIVRGWVTKNIATKINSWYRKNMKVNLVHLHIRIVGGCDKLKSWLFFCCIGVICFVYYTIIAFFRFWVLFFGNINLYGGRSLAEKAVCWTANSKQLSCYSVHRCFADSTC